MPISVMTLSDAPTGRSFEQWVNELVYTMGAAFNFDTVPVPKPDLLVLSLTCLPPHLNYVRSGTSFKRASSEYVSSYSVDHASFVSTDPARRVAALRDGLCGAVEQLPKSRMPSDLKARFVAAAYAASTRLAQSPERHPRGPN